MTKAIKAGLAQRGIVKANGWKFREGLERRGYQKIEAHRDVPTVEGGRKVVYCEIFTVGIENGVPQWEKSGKYPREKMLPGRLSRFDN